MDSHSIHYSSKKRKVASCPGNPQDFEARETVRLYPEVELAVKVKDPITNEEVRVSGRADWGFGYYAAHGTFLVAMGTKRRELFSGGEAQLVAYLAILRELRIQAGKENAVTQGFYTDGYRYCFMTINADGNVESSPVYNVTNPAHGKTIFNFIFTILESAMKCSPTVTPTKDAKQREKEISNFPGEGWAKVYEPYLDGEEEDFMELPPLELGY